MVGPAGGGRGARSAGKKEERVEKDPIPEAGPRRKRGLVMSSRRFESATGSISSRHFDE